MLPASSMQLEAPSLPPGCGGQTKVSAAAPRFTILITSFSHPFCTITDKSAHPPKGGCALLSVEKPDRRLVRRMRSSLLQLRGIRWPIADGRFMNRPYGPGAAGRCGHRPLRMEGDGTKPGRTSARETSMAWQCGRLFRHFLNSNYYQVWAGHVPQGRQPYLHRAQTEPSPERFQVLQVA